MIRLRLAGSVALLSLLGCASHRSRAGSEAHFVRRDEIEILPEPWASPSPTSSSRELNLSLASAVHKHQADRLAVAFVVDTLGRVEPRSMTFVVSPKDYDFVRAVCKMLPGAQFTKPEQRVLVVQSFAFETMNGPPVPPSPFAVDTMVARLREMPDDKLFEHLESRQHCW